ncbi:MAG: sensor histidine kinase [Thermocrispum sp.]
MLIRSRLALAMATLFVVVLGVMGFVVYELTHSTVLAEVRGDLVARASAAGAALTRRPRTAPAALVDAVATETVYVELTDGQGRLLARSANAPGDRLIPDPTGLPDNAAVEYRLNGVPLLVAAERVNLTNDDRYVVLARTPQPAYEALSRLRAVLLPAVLVATVLAAGLAWFSVRRSLAPLTRLDAAAEAIARRGDHRARVGGEARSDEIGRLAANIDSMLAALERSHRAVSTAHETQRRFLTDVSHELRAPLTLMQSALELAERIGPEDPEFAEQVMADLLVEVQRMSRSVKQLLTMARTGDNGTTVRRPLLLADLVGELCQRWLRGGKEIDFATTAPPVDTVVSGDADQLRQVFEILLDNACAYTPNAGRVWVECGAQGGTAVATVADTGAGIAAANLPRIFDRYTRGSPPPGPESGLGLGLSIAARIVAEHAGTITVESEPDKGSRFTVSLPVATAESR